MLTRRQLIKGSAALVLSPIEYAASETVSPKKALGLKEAFKNDFLIGVMLTPEQYLKRSTQIDGIVTTEFNSITSNNSFKWESIHPTTRHWDWSYADEFVNYGLENRMHMVGHSLIWHAQLPVGLFETRRGRQPTSKSVQARMDNHIATIVDRYKGKVNSWDVVNEALGSNQKWQPSPWLNYLGPSYIERAFKIAHEADPRAELVYNDYGLAAPEKRKHLLEMLKDLQKNKTPLHAVGMQGHFNLTYPHLNEVEKTIMAISKTGLKVHISELEVDVLPNPSEQQDSAEKANLNPWPLGLPTSVEDKLAVRYSDIFKLLVKQRKSIGRVTLWGLADQNSWKNDFPIEGRTNYPLLFNRKFQKKKAYQSLLNLKK